MARLPPPIADLARQFVCVRVTDMRAVDLARWRFDFDLTFAALTAAPDGTIFHRYGGRDASDPEAALSLASLGAFLRGSLEDWTGYRKAQHAPELPPARTIIDLPVFRQRDTEKRVDCVHCHTVNDFEHKDAVARNAFRREQMWVFPDPARLGLEVERDDQAKVASVSAGSPAAKAGLQPGDRLLRAKDQRLLTRADLQWTLHGLPFAQTVLPLEFERAGERGTVEIALADGWKAADPFEYSWRPYKWNLPPHPGFGGKLLDPDATGALRLAAGAFAMRVNYLVTWGENARCGRNAERAGLKVGDLLLGVDGKRDFKSEAHFQAWYRIALTPGRKVELVVLREGKQMKLELLVIE